jgi:hypothetical protein
MHEEDGDGQRGGPWGARLRRVGAKTRLLLLALARTAVALLVSATLLANTGCADRTRVPPSSLPQLLAARGNDVTVRDDEGHLVTVDRSEIDEIWIQPHPRRVLMVDRPWDARLGPAMAVSIPEDYEEEAERLGWSSLDPLEGRMALDLRGGALVVDDVAPGRQCASRTWPTCS